MIMLYNTLDGHNLASVVHVKMQNRLSSYILKSLLNSSDNFPFFAEHCLQYPFESHIFGKGECYTKTVDQNKAFGAMLYYIGYLAD